MKDTTEPNKASPIAKAGPSALAATAALTCAVLGGIYMAATIGAHSSLLPAVIISVAAYLFMTVSLVGLILDKHYSRPSFVKYVRGALLAYLLEAGILEFIFAYDQVPSKVFAILSALLVIFATSVPVIIGHTVAGVEPS